MSATATVDLDVYWRNAQSASEALEIETLRRTCNFTAAAGNKEKHHQLAWVGVDLDPPIA